MSRHVIASDFEGATRYWNGVYQPALGFGLVNAQIPTTHDRQLATLFTDRGTASERADGLTELSRSAPYMDARTWFVVELPKAVL